MAQNPLIPGYGGDMFSIDASPMLPDYMQGINEALARNQSRVAEQESKPKFDIGKFLVAWAGHMGDNLSGNTAYADAVQRMSESKAQSRASEEKRRRDMEDWVSQREYLAAQQRLNPKYEGSIDHYDQAKARGLIPPDTDYPTFLRMNQPPPAPQMIPYGYEPVGGAPSGGPGDNIPTLSSPEQAAGLPPGTRFRTPDGRIKIVPGGQSAPPTGGFP